MCNNGFNTIVIETKALDFAVRLVSIPGVNSTGRVEVRYNGTWGTICSKGFSNKDATMICKGLGFQSMVRFKEGSIYGNGKGPIWLSQLDCTGKESNIAACRHSGWGINNCTHDQDIELTCYDRRSN